ncbi:MAG: glutamate-5-semialdehyde dehydrogenase [Oscillospiraceae bacterium]|jgi:glutamate-5-semialdehyde dehydrogenase|nr:glutamate-5-semialdehyde dehydrogenase [Oscillospiraceae bacterium]
MTVAETAKQARAASRSMASLTIASRDQALIAMADALLNARDRLFDANNRDLANAHGLPEPVRKRLIYNEKKLRESVDELRALAAAPDPLGRTTLARMLADGLKLYRVSCPIGVVGVIFESRPDALVQIAALCLKSGNAALLKGGSEASYTNRALFEALNAAAISCGIPEGWASLFGSREDVAEMLALDDLIDLIIPRGGNAFVRYIKENSRIPVLGHADGVCHVYVDVSERGENDRRAPYADCALRVVRDSKTQYAAVCNAVETLLVHKDAAEAFLPELAKNMPEVELRGCPAAQRIINCKSASDADWDAEYLDYILSVRVVDSLDEAIEHINRHGSGHTDAIVTDSPLRAARFLAEADSANVFHNCSTRFADGYRYGFGAELGIATGKIHARGPVGLEGLTIYKYKLLGAGHTVADTQDGTVAYLHKPLDEECPL